jgi:regulation of enolase protein 1 (concanavalin A-like superfamily)
VHNRGHQKQQRPAANTQGNTIMKFALSALIVLGSIVAAPAQELGDTTMNITLPGLTFTRSLNGAAQNATVADGRLTITSDAKRDNFIDPDGKLSNNTAPVLLTEVDNTKPFTLTATLTPQFHATYDAGATYIWVKDDLWFKFAMEQNEDGRIRIVSVRTNGTSDDNNHDVVAATSVSMKISSDTRTVGFYYSVDGKRWILIRLFKNDYPAKIWLGVSAQSPTGNGTSAVFENIALAQKSITNFRMGE